MKVNHPRRELLKLLGSGALTATLGTGLSPRARGGTAAPRIKIGQIGVGHAHASKLSVYRQSADYEVVGIVEPDAELRSAAEAQAAFRGLPWLTQEQLFNQPDLQAVLVETRVRDSLRTAQACVAAGKHIHLDKPAGESLPQFRDLLAAAERQKLLVQMGYMYRYNPGFVLLRQFLERGWLGEPFEVHAVMSKVVAPASRRELTAYPGGILFELGCHLIDLVVKILGQPEQVAGYARHSGAADDGLRDNMLAVFAYPRALATVKSTATEVDGGARRHLVVCGTEGTFQIQPLDDPAVRVTLSTARDKYRRGYQDLTLPAYTRYVDDAADMARVIRGEKAADYSYEHDLHVQTALLEACGLPLDT
ncbi:MAG: Gfo/Idh/MocA family oxidoreductase [Planctomycetaceae bacterium]|nr:Gfo/Idh/MocA family oxidoreductase [Planctomycetaceae bacterium]